MKTNCVTLAPIAVCLMIAIAALDVPFGGTVLAEREQASILGGQCQVKAFVPCFQATIANSNVCGACNANRTCTSSNASEECKPVDGPTSPADCISCGTCNNDCGGQEIDWKGPKCSGSFTLNGNCGFQWVDAVNGACAQACPGS